MNSAAKACQAGPSEIWIKIRFFCRLFLISSLHLIALNRRGETASGRGSRGLAAHEYALMAGNEAEAHGASVHGMRAYVQGTLAPERKGNQLCSTIFDI